MDREFPAIADPERPDGADMSPEMERLVGKARKASDFLKAMSHENRLLLLCLLAEREHTVSELENLLSLRQAMVSQQLARLRLDQLVTTRRNGKTIHYRLASDDVRQLLAVIYNIFCREPDDPPRLNG